jgi:predicted molibdopterin-dependent oxidoreductase YjgC
VNHPVAASFMKNAIKRGTKLILADPRGQGLTRHATLDLRFKPGSVVALLNALLLTIIAEGLIDVDEVWGVESHLYYENLWAGTTDLSGLYMGRPAIMDFKTTIKPKKREWVEDYQMQLTAYAMAHDSLFNTNIQTAVVFMVSRDCEFQKFVWTGTEFEEGKLKWANRVSDYYERFVF